MANTEWQAAITRPGWGGASSATDIHLEVYDNDLDTKFQYTAMFKSLSAQKSVAERSNTYRFDRLAGSVVKTRTSGVALDASRVVSDKAVVTVTAVMYVRHAIDYQDDWTAPDFLRELAANDATAMAEQYDKEHIIQLQLCRGWVAPAHLKGAAAGNAFYDGAEITCAQEATPASQAELEANAIALEAAHLKAVETLITRKVSLADQVTLVTPAVFSALKYHPKLLNSEFDTTNGGAFGERRVIKLNGIPVIECTEFPIAGDVTQTQGTPYTVLAADAACEMIVFSKTKTLITVEAQPFTSRVFDDEIGFANVLDCYSMYTVGQRRPDTAVVVKLNRT